MQKRKRKGSPNMAEEYDGEITFSPTNTSKDQSACGTTSTEYLLNAGGWPQMPRKANQSLWNEVGQKIKMKRKTKDLGTETHLGEGVVKEKFPHNRKPSHRQDQWGVLESQRASKLENFTEIIPNSNYQPRSGSHARIHWLWKSTGLNSRRAKGMWEIKTSLEGLIHRTNLHQVSGQRQELEKYLGHTRERFIE